MTPTTLIAPHRPLTVIYAEDGGTCADCPAFGKLYPYLSPGAAVVRICADCARRRLRGCRRRALRRERKGEGE